VARMSERNTEGGWPTGRPKSGRGESKDVGGLVRAQVVGSHRKRLAPEFASRTRGGGEKWASL